MKKCQNIYSYWPKIDVIGEREIKQEKITNYIEANLVKGSRNNLVWIIIVICSARQCKRTLD